AGSALCRTGRPGPGCRTVDQCDPGAHRAPAAGTHLYRGRNRRTDRPAVSADRRFFLHLRNLRPVVFMTQPRHFLTLNDLAPAELEGLIDRAIVLKNMLRNGSVHEPLRNRILAMVFEKSSTRTRVSFE